MRGLLVKDIKLMKIQKNFFVVIIAVALGMTAFMEDSTFIIGYMTFIGSLFTLSTISYDEFDNGNAFLFTLPITRKTYVIEKYTFGLIVGGMSWLFATIVAVVAGILKSNLPIKDTMMIAFLTLPVLLMILAVMLPFQLKFGGEKGRIAIIGAVGLLFIVGIVIVKIAEMFHIDLISLFNHLPTLSMGMFIIVAMIICIILLLISIKISFNIMNKKEF